VWKQKGAPKSTTTPPKSNKMVWRKKGTTHFFGHRCTIIKQELKEKSPAKQ
jgi:hypothetical protein